MRVRTLCASLLLGAAALLATGSPAQAIPQDCNTSSSGGIHSSFCASGTGEHQIAVRARFLDPTLGFTYFYGPWAPVGGTSSVKVRCGCMVEAVWINKR